jgi:hypothetical protein
MPTGIVKNDYGVPLNAFNKLVYRLCGRDEQEFYARCRDAYKTSRSVSSQKAFKAVSIFWVPTFDENGEVDRLIRSESPAQAFGFDIEDPVQKTPEEARQTTRQQAARDVAEQVKERDTRERQQHAEISAKIDKVGQLALEAKEQGRTCSEREQVRWVSEHMRLPAHAIHQAPSPSAAALLIACLMDDDAARTFWRSTFHKAMEITAREEAVAKASADGDPLEEELREFEEEYGQVLASIRMRGRAMTFNPRTRTITHPPEPAPDTLGPHWDEPQTAEAGGEDGRDRESA